MVTVKSTTQKSDDRMSIKFHATGSELWEMRHFLKLPHLHNQQEVTGRDERSPCLLLEQCGNWE